MTDENSTDETLDDYLPFTPDTGDERLQKFREQFPDLFDGEGKLKLDDIRQLVGDEPIGRERYDFGWYGKRNAKAKAYAPTTATLSYDEKRSVNPDKADGNLIIEGENLEALKCLLSAYRESVKCIYIDPPYNTGKDFVYSDNFTEGKRAYWEETGGLEEGVKIDTNPETAGRYHSNWLSMIYPRLLLSRQLLKDDGVIFVSIDDHEVHNLRRVMDEIFGEENFLTKIIVQSNKRGQTYKEIAKCHEYVLVYYKTEESSLNELEKASDLPFEDADGRYDLWELRNRNPKFGRFNRPNLYYPIYVNEDSIGRDGLAEISLKKSEHYSVEVLPRNSEGTDSCWRWGQTKLLDEGIDLKQVWAKKKRDGGWNIYEKSRKSTTKAKSIWADNQVISEQGTIEAGKLGMGNLLEFPKPLDLIKRAIFLGTDKDDLVVDFFAGSGTTAHAVASLNMEDGGNRKFIIIQLPAQTPEKSEARSAGYTKISDITIARVKRVIEGYGDEPQPLDTGFKVYQLAKSHFPRVEFQPDHDKTEAENIEAVKRYIAEKEAQLTGLFEPSEIQDEVLLKNGFRLNYTLADAPEFPDNTVRLADDGHKQSLLCLDTMLKSSTVDYLVKNPQPFICLEVALTTTDKWNLRQHLKHQFVAF